MHALLLNCTRCETFTEFYRKDDDPDTVVRCDGCGKRHSSESIYSVDPDRQYERDESGILIDERIPK